MAVLQRVGIVKGICLGLCLFFSMCCLATDYKPWYGRTLEFEARADLLYQTYHTVAAGHTRFTRHANDVFLDLSLANSFDAWAIELESVFADTQHHSFNVDCFKTTGRYRWLNDVIGDLVSLTTGISIIAPFTIAKQDISSFHHGNVEYLAHCAVGKETACGEFWVSRYYGVLGIGMANRGYPWLMGELHKENRFYGSHLLRFFLKGLYGCGPRALHRKKHFRGYGPIAHRSVDIGAGYLYEFDNYSTFSIDYAYRVYAENFPLRASLVKIEYLYPFGI